MKRIYAGTSDEKETIVKSGTIHGDEISAASANPAGYCCRRRGKTGM
jgi:hypothetical protein